MLYKYFTEKLLGLQDVDIEKLEEIDKFADGIAVQKVGVKTYEVARKYVDRLLGVDEGLISETLIDMYSKVGTIAEPAGAASVAALEVIKDEFSKFLERL